MSTASRGPGSYIAKEDGVVRVIPMGSHSPIPTDLIFLVRKVPAQTLSRTGAMISKGVQAPDQVCISRVATGYFGPIFSAESHKYDSSQILSTPLFHTCQLLLPCARL